MSDEVRRTNVLLEELMYQFRTFGEDLQQLNAKMDAHIEENRMEFQMIQTRMDRQESKLSQLQESNDREHRQIIQAVHDLDGEVKRIDSEVVQIKRIK